MGLRLGTIINKGQQMHIDMRNNNQINHRD